MLTASAKRACSPKCTMSASTARAFLGIPVIPTTQITDRHLLSRTSQAACHPETTAAGDSRRRHNRSECLCRNGGHHCW